MEELLALKGNVPEFQLSAFSWRKRFDSETGQYVEFTPEERAGFVDELAEKSKKIYDLAVSVSKAFVEIGYLLREIDSKHLFSFVSIKSQTFVDIHDFAFKVFGFQKSTTYNLMNVVDTFGDGEGGILSHYRAYSYTQLVNLLPFTGYERKMFTPEATVAEIKELRAGLKKYPRTEWRSSDYGKKITWRSELDRVRKAAAEDAVSEKKDKKEERKQGLLSMLNAAETSPSSSSSAAAAVQTETVVEVVAPSKDKDKLELKNREERKKWVEGVFEGASPYWTLPELDLKIYRYVFVNGARLFRFDGFSYTATWYPTEHVIEETVTKYFITDDKCPKFDMCRSRSVNQVVDWLTEHSKEI